MNEWIAEDDKNLDAVIEQLNAYRSSFMSTTKYPKIMCSVRLDQEQVQMIDAYIRNQKHQPSFSGVMRLALQRLRKRCMTWNENVYGSNTQKVLYQLNRGTNQMMDAVAELQGIDRHQLVLGLLKDHILY